MPLDPPAEVQARLLSDRPCLAACFRSRWRTDLALLSTVPCYNERLAVEMALYLARFSYTPETWTRLAQKPEDRRDAARAYIEAVGGKLHGFWYAFGEYDAYNLWEAPDNVSMAAVAMAISGGGALSKYETTVLLTVEETMDAMQRARDIRYRPPGT